MLFKDLARDVSLSALVAGFVAVLVGFTSSVAIVFAAAQALGATPAQTTSWMWALGLGMGLTSAGLSLWTRQPVLTAWSTPGVALLAGTSGVAMGDAAGAFVVCGALMALAGFSGVFERVMDRIPQAVNEQAMAMLEKVGLKDWAKHMPNEMSGGQKQRVAIARALISSPKIILADEPTGALDSKTSEEVMELLTNVNKELGLTVVIVTHERAVAAATQRVIRLKDGLIENAHMDPATLLADVQQ